MNGSPNTSLRAISWSQRAALLEAAAQLIGERGAHGFTTRALAKRPGISAGAIYRNLGDRDTVLLALIEREGARFAKRLEAADGTVSEPRQDEPAWRPAARVRLRALITYYREHPALAAELDLEERRLKPQSPRGVRAVMEKMFVAFLKVHALSADEEELSAEYLVELVTGMALVAGRGEGKTDGRALARVLSALSGYLKSFGR